MGSGPIYVESGGEAFLNYGPATITNAFSLPQGTAWLAAATEGALRLGSGDLLTGTITLMGSPIIPGATAGTTSATIGDRISLPAATDILSGQITGTGTLEVFFNWFP